MSVPVAPTALAAQQHAERIAGELPRLSEAVVQEAHVVLLDEIGMVPEHGDRRRLHAHLRGIVQLHLAAGGLRRLTPSEQLGQPLVHLRRRDALPTLVIDELDEIEDLRYTLTGERRCEEEGHPVEKRRLLTRRLLELGARLVVLLGEIPLVDD